MTKYDATNYGHKSIVGFLAGTIITGLVAVLGLIASGVGSTISLHEQVAIFALAFIAGAIGNFFCAMIAEPDTLHRAGRNY